MSTSRTRIARFAASAALVLSFGALSVGPALAGGIISPASAATAVTFASEDGVTLGEDQIDKARFSEDGAAWTIIGLDYNDETNGNGYWL